MSLDKAQERFSDILRDVTLQIDRIQNEEDTKIKIILRVLTEALDWSISNIDAERNHENGFSDFIISEAQNNAFVLEAKRIGSIDILTAETEKVRHLKISGPMLQNAQAGIDQVVGYALQCGISLAVLTDGIAWIIFKTFTPGTSFKSHEAFVFPSLNAVLNDFSIFYELLSRTSLAKKLYAVHFDKLHNSRLLLSQPLKSPLGDYEIRIKQKSDLAFDLDNVFTAFFTRLTGDDDANLLIECFVETRESRIADFALEKITANVLGNISSPEKDVDAELKALIESAVDIEAGQTVFIVGPSGAGKSTFLERFFQKTLSELIKNQCVVIQVNCLDSSGREDTAIQWCTEELIKGFERQIFRDGIATWEELRGLFFSEYERRRVGVDAQLYKKDKAAFQEKFSTYLGEKVETDREGYLRRIIADIVKNRKKLPIILIDNTDEFTPEYKKEIFQFCQSLRRDANHCILIFPVTDKSAWAFSKTDLYGIYRSKSFFLPTPPPREVFRKRIDYIREKISSLVTEDEKRKYLAGKGIRISIKNLQGFASVIEEVFVDDDYASSTIGELTNYNIRKTLELSQRVITSSVYNIEDILSAYMAGSIDIIQNHTKFINALLKGDYDAFKANDNHFILPIFQVDHEIKQSPLLPLRILALLNVTKNAARTVEDKHLSVQSVFDYFDTMGVSEVSVDKALLRLMESGLIEAFDASQRQLTVGQRVAITFNGNRHLNLALFNSVFQEQMAITTAIVDLDVVEKIRGAYLSQDRFLEKMDKVRQLFLEYLIKEDATHSTTPEKGDQYDHQKDLINELSKRAHSKAISVSGNATEDTSVTVGVIATVDWFDNDKGFGFVEAEGLDGQAFLHVDKVKVKGIDNLFDGDKILCDIRRNHKGHYVSSIHDLEPITRETETAECTVIRLFPDRRYGFVKVGDGSRDAFLHFSICDDSVTSKLKVGAKFNGEICPDKSGTGFLVRKII